MKKYLIPFILLYPFIVFAQSPLRINYQAIVRNNNGQPVSANTALQFKFEIRNSTVSGSVVYSETSNIILANDFGLATLAVGENGNLEGVNWTNGAKFLNVQVKIGSGVFTDMGTTQLLSVPYSLFASNASIADSIRGGIPGGATQSISVKVLYNSISLTDPSIDHAILALSGNYVSALTSTNYYYGLYRGSNTVASFNNSVILATDTTSNNPTFYTYSSPLGCTNSPYPNSGQIFGINTNHTSGVYYWPLNAVGTTSPPQLYQYSCTTGHWAVWQSQYFINYQYFQVLPNLNSVTGFNLQFPLTVTITR